MAVLSKEDYLNRVKTIVGEDMSDENVSLIEDFSDTYDDLESRANVDTTSDEEWQKKYDDLDAEWRKKYTDRFFSSEDTGETNTGTKDSNEEVDESPKTFDDLFEEVKE